MKKISELGALLKKIYRKYSQDLISSLQSKGFIDLRPSFLEILSYISETDSPSIKEIGRACGLKKQTMTSHLNELEKRGYIKRSTGLKDRREQIVLFTEYGDKFKVALLDAISDLEEHYLKSVSEVELERIVLSLSNLHLKIEELDKSQKSLI
jgi:DNA-binding MarR family transcriptional regulator